MRKTQVKITGKRDCDSIRIYFNGILHVEISAKNHDGIQAWQDAKGKYVIEFYRVHGNNIELWYDTLEKWKQVLKLIDELI